MLAPALPFRTIWERSDFATTEDGDEYNIAVPEGCREHTTLADAQAAAAQGYSFWTGSEDCWAPVFCTTIEDWREGRCRGSYLRMDEGWRWYPV